MPWEAQAPLRVFSHSPVFHFLPRQRASTYISCCLTAGDKPIRGIPLKGVGHLDRPLLVVCVIQADVGAVRQKQELLIESGLLTAQGYGLRGV